jgi:hypothetical protein
MTNESNKNGGKGRKKPVKKQKTLDELAQELYQKSLEQLNQAREMEKVVNEYCDRAKQKTEEPKKPAPNPCKYCLFQKECPLFTISGRFAYLCIDKIYDEEVKKIISEGVCSYDKSLIYWHDTQEQLNKRFNLN